MIKYTRRTVMEATTFVRKPPEDLQPQNRDHFDGIMEYQCPAMDICHFPRVWVLPDATLFNGVWPINWSFLFFRKRIITHNVNGLISIRLRWKKEVLKKVEHPYLLIHDAWTTNYYHWITQALPRLVLAQKFGSEFLLLLPEDHTKPFHEASLRAMGVKTTTKLKTGRHYYRIDNLLYPAHDVEIGSYNDNLMRELRDRFRQPKKLQDRSMIFVHRNTGKGRRMMNEAAVLQTFVSFGFQIISFEDKSFADQVEIVSQASVLAGVHGAGLTNLIFLQSSATVFELTSRLQGDQYYYFTLSGAMDHRYYYLFCEPVDRKETIQLADFMVDLDMLHASLKKIIQQKNA